MKLQNFLIINTIIDRKETKKTGIGLIFVGIISLIISFLLQFEFVKPEYASFPAFSLTIIGIILIIIGIILSKEFFK
jgi:protein-S-isoprenylcysteine O-methyltransferase Ste14